MKILYKSKKIEKAFEELRDVSNNKESLKKYISFDLLRMIKKELINLLHIQTFIVLLEVQLENVKN